jgi:hypothetical protein
MFFLTKDKEPKHVLDSQLLFDDLIIIRVTNNKLFLISFHIMKYLNSIKFYLKLKVLI